MLAIEYVSKIVLVIVSVVLFLVSFGVVVAIQFQNKQSKKYKECLKLIKDKEDGILSVNNGLDIDEIKKIDSNVDVNKLMEKLYKLYVEFVEKFNNNDENISYVLDEFTNQIYQNKLEIYKTKKINEITDDIELQNYSILSYEKDKIEFRISITCFNYKMKNGTIISGSNLNRIAQIFVVTFVKPRKKWLIKTIEKVFEQNVSI